MRFAFSATRRWVMIGAGVGALAYGALAVVSISAWGWEAERNQAMLIFAAVASAVGGLMASRDRVFSGGLVSLGGAWCEVHHSLLTSPEFPTPSLIATSALLVAGTLLLRPRHSVYLAVVSLVLTWPLVILSPPVRASGITPSVLYWLTAHAVVTGSVWALVTLGFSIVDSTFAVVVGKERELAETIDRAPDGILVIDANQAVQVINPAAERLLAAPAQECRGRPILDVLAAAAAPTETTHPTSYKTSSAGPRAWAVQQPDGTRIDVEVSWRMMDGGRYQLVLRDVSERVKAEEARRDMELQLAHAQRLEAVGQLAGGIAHDFNNILTIVGASAEVLRAELQDERHWPLLDEILAAQERGATLTRQLLAFARREVVHPRVFDLSAHVLSLHRLLQRVAGEQTRIWCDVEPDCLVRADVGQVEQALVNLVTNARDAMPEGGTCALTVVQMTNDDGERWVRVRVRDEGVGMDAATQARAFEPFFTTKPRGRGTGLGLAAVHGMAMQSGGRVDIESMPGRGTSVLLEFPYADAPATARSAPPAPQEQETTGGTILVAEDDDGTRATVARILQRLGYTVLLAPDGMQALRMAEANADRIDLLLTDVMMPGLSGPGLAARLREVAPHVPVVFMSGYPEDALAEVEGLRLETDFVAKPFASATLARCVSDKLRAALVAPVRAR